MLRNGIRNNDLSLRRS